MNNEIDGLIAEMFLMLTSQSGNPRISDIAEVYYDVAIAANSYKDKSMIGVKAVKAIKDAIEGLDNQQDCDSLCSIPLRIMVAILEGVISNAI